MDGHILQPSQITGALVEGLLVGIDVPDVLQLGAGFGQQVVAHLQPGGADDGEVVADHQVIHRVHRTGGAVFDWQDAILAHAALHRLEHVVKALEIHDGGGLEQAVTGDLRVSALDALAGHGGPLGEQLGGLLHGLFDAVIDLGAPAQLAVLIGAAGGHDGAVHGLDVVGQLLPSLLAHLAQQGPLPAGVQHGHIVGLFILGHLGHRLHPPLHQVHDLPVNGVDVPPKLL